MFKHSKLNNDNKLIFSLNGDGELQEGQNWEAIMYASAKKIDNIIATIDVNGQQIDGPVDEIYSLLNLKDKLKSFGWKVYECDGNENGSTQTNNIYVYSD